MKWRDYITSDLKILAGKPVIKGTSIKCKINFLNLNLNKKYG